MALRCSVTLPSGGELQCVACPVGALLEEGSTIKKIAAPAIFHWPKSKKASENRGFLHGA
jgi:hypothetical protein